MYENRRAEKQTLERITEVVYRDRMYMYVCR